jgi:hypothetical protein
MSRQFDNFSKSLAEDSIPRRQSLRLLGAAIAGAVLSPLATAWGANSNDACKSFCRCSNKQQQNACLSACRTCNGDTSRLSGSCGSYTCCSTASCDGVCSELNSDPNCGACGNDCRDFGETCCGSYCSDLDNDFYNCGACGFVCDPPGPNEQGACIKGYCVHWCNDGASVCNGVCTAVGSDPNHCGTCDNACSGETPYCYEGKCVSGDDCGGADFMWDSLNCGGCGNVCPDHFSCAWGVCEGSGWGDYYGY